MYDSPTHTANYSARITDQIYNSKFGTTPSYIPPQSPLNERRERSTAWSTVI